MTGKGKEGWESGSRLEIKPYVRCVTECWGVGDSHAASLGIGSGLPGGMVSYREDSGFSYQSNVMLCSAQFCLCLSQLICYQHLEALAASMVNDPET